MHRSGRHFLQIPGPTNVPDRVLRAIDAPTIDHRGPDFALLGRRAERPARGVQDVRAGRRLPGVRHRRVGGGAGQHALAGRQVLIAYETGHFATLWRAMAERSSGSRSSVGRETTGGTALDPDAHRRRAGRDMTCDQGRDGRAQRDLDRRDQSRIADVRAAMTGRPRRAAARGHDLVARLDRLPPRRVGRGRDRRRLAEGPDAAAGSELQRDLARRRCATRERGCRAPTGTGIRSSPPTRPASCRTRRPPTCSTGCARRWRCCARRGWRTSSRAMHVMPRRRVRPSPGGASRCCAVDREYSVVADRGAHARRLDADAVRKVDPRALRHVARRRASASSPDRVFRIGHLGDFNDLMLAGTLCGRADGAPCGWARRR